MTQIDAYLEKLAVSEALMKPVFRSAIEALRLPPGSRPLPARFVGWQPFSLPWYARRRIGEGV